MSTVLTFAHIILAFTIILVVLLQEGKAGMGISFGGGSSNTVFGSSGAGNFLVKVTIIAGALFMITSLSLTKTGSQKEGVSVMESVKVPAVVPSPVAPVKTEKSATAPTVQDGASAKEVVPEGKSK